MAVVLQNLWLGLLFTSCGVTWGIDLTFEPPSNGFFIKPLADKVSNSVRGSKTFYIPRSQDSNILEAHYGPFSNRKSVEGNQSRATPSYRFGQYDISAHLLSHALNSQEPKVSVLGHLALLNLKASKRITDFLQHKWCLQVEVHQEKKVAISACVLKDHENTCLANVHLSPDWWDKPQAHVYYIVYPVNRGFECSADSNLIVPERAQQSVDKQNLGVLSLVNGGAQQEFREIREDQHILVDLPRKPVFPGSSFHVPVKLQAESDLQHFVVRVKTRFGLRVVGVRALDPKKWQVTVDINHRQRMAMITAYVSNARAYTKSSSIQEIFICEFEVDNRTSGEVQVGRVIWTFEYEVIGNKKSHYGDPYNKVVSRIAIQHDRIRTIVPIVKEMELVNTAMLTGQTAIYPVKVYGVSEAGRVKDITSEVLCYSMDEQVIKVTPPCNSVYVDTTTTQGSLNTSVVIKFGHYARFLTFRVWVPETPLNVHVEDPKLSQIKGWKVQEPSSRRKRGVDFGLLTYPNLLLKDKKPRPEPVKSCHLRYQQSEVRVYSRFYAISNDKKEFLVSRKAFLDITDVVLGRLRVADNSIASLRRNILQGKMPGRTEVQVRLPSGHMVGAKEIRVTNDKVAVNRLVISLVTGVSLKIIPGIDFPGTHIANANIQQSLYAKYQEGLLDIVVQMNDKTQMPLTQVMKEDYSLRINTFDNHVIVFGPSYSNDQPRVIAVGEGKGELVEVELEMKDVCQRKKSRPLKASTVYVDVDFNNFKYKELQNDGNFGVDNRAGNRWKQPTVSEDEKVKNNFGKQKDVKKEKIEKPSVEASSDGVKIFPSSLDLNLPSNVGDVQAGMVQQKPVSEPISNELSPLEIGMYVLLGVFSLAIGVFLINCVVYFMRYKGKRLPHDSRESLAPANEWVWIGRSTLERNLVNTKLETTLMSEEDFNGNPTVASRPPSASELAEKRNSGVSTYRGSECSIRITTNPCEAEEPVHDDVGDDDTFEDPIDAPEEEYKVLGMTSEQFAEYFANLKESSA